MDMANRDFLGRTRDDEDEPRIIHSDILDSDRYPDVDVEVEKGVERIFHNVREQQKKDAKKPNK